MKISTYISIPIFILSFIVGIICIFIFGPETKTVRVYPTPDNYKDLIYKDNANQCFSLFPVDVKCPADINEIQDIPIQ
jgi:hypothetical protein